jgi:hypothetical protein
MAIDTTFNFKNAIRITEDDVDNIFALTDGELERLHIPTNTSRTLVAMLNGDLDHVVLRRAIERLMKETVTV